MFTQAYSEWLKMSKQDVAKVNLDPGAVNLPYTPDVDVRNYVNVENLMQEYGLGPNGALVMAADLIADQIESINDEIEEQKADIILIDTSGQMELFAFRASGPYITTEILKDEPKTIIYLFDAVFSANPQNYVSNMFLSAAVQNRFLHPQIHVLSKSDLLPKTQVDKIVDWSVSPQKLETAINENLEGTKRLLNLNMARVIHKLGLKFLLMPISAKTNEGMTNVNVALERLTAQGDKYTY